MLQIRKTFKIMSIYLKYFKIPFYSNSTSGELQVPQEYCHPQFGPCSPQEISNHSKQRPSVMVFRRRRHTREMGRAEVHRLTKEAGGSPNLMENGAPALDGLARRKVQENISPVLTSEK